MDKDFKNWPGGYPPDAAEGQAKQVAAQVEHSCKVSNALPEDSHVKQVAKQFDGSTNMTKLPRPTRWEGADSRARPEHQAKSSGVLNSMVSMLTGSSAPHKESLRAMEEHYETLLANAKWENEVLGKDILRYREKLHTQKREEEDALQSLADEAHRNIAKDKNNHERQMIRERNAHSWELHRVKQDCSTHIEAAKKEKEMAENSCKKLEHEFEVMERKIRDLQSVQLQSVEAVKWAPHSHSDIEHKLKSIFARVRQWATEYSFLDIDQVLDPDFFADMATRLKNRGCIGDANLLYHALCSNKSMKKPGKAFAMVLAADLSFEIMLETIGDPFCAFVGRGEDKYVLGERHARCFRALVQLIRNCDVAGAENLRCQLLRLLDPVANDAVSVNLMKRIAKESRELAAETIANKLFETYTEKLVAERSTDARNSLKALTQEAVDLSWELWTRKARIEVLVWADLQEHVGKTIQYGADAKALEAHPLHNRELEDEPQALDGAEVVLLCSPAIAIAGTAEGRDYDKEKLIKKAIVVVG
ncbi:hypothetical protein CERZMDRAFT_100274 [Cercospora zeae-maydis SCOH1-5]|uniref:Uncharacterized protein n=1 Tax=Cercospora zeae-maydis SCOH1-5 TaxID=717836 RepID=A0A6A6F7Z2_9PEZI|nr:hypothetical protein CERZMDRAFT_100274 [Cercospora zeae-maydis SCOH1-5]